ncbi:cytochrome P450 2J2-like [Vombatus ursinus]|uniref:cytochrome P450 2J2-like n=1 Tax=Vombatus ursinus TaxID=29139 RepID=UPI000FFD1CC0|nr:cytochrome P450 2J2-like [Vombatus ursinus]
MRLSLENFLPSLWERASLQTLFFLSVILLILAQYLQRRRRHHNYPPGPPGLPIFGNFFQMDLKNPNITLQKFAKKYGNVFCTHVGNLTFLVVTGLPLIKEVLVNQDQVFIDRPQVPVHFHIIKSFGIVMSNGQTWKQQRRFALMTLRNFGLGKKTLEDRIREEARYLTEAIKEEEGQPFDPHFQINNAVSNIICSITFGHRFEYHDSHFRELLKSLDDILKLETRWECQVFNIFPWAMKYLPGSHQKLFQEWKKLESFIESVIKQHKEDLNPEESLDFIDAYLKELSKDNIHSSFDEKNLVFCTLDLFFAGTETTSTTLRWALLYMAFYPEIQGKIQAEIDRVVGQLRQPTMADKENMPYTNAAIHEVQRMGDILPFNVPRVATVDTTVAGYHVPKVIELCDYVVEYRTTVSVVGIGVQYLVQFTWKNRDRKRICLGEQLARAELFLFFTCLLQKFTFQAPLNTKLSLDPEVRVTTAPASYQICAIPRVM